MIVIGVVLSALGTVIYLRPSVGWMPTRWRMGRVEADAYRRRHGDSSIKWLGVALVLGGMVVMGIGIKYAML